MNCSVLEGVECTGDRSFIKTGVPCLRLVSVCNTTCIIILTIFNHNTGTEVITFQVCSSILFFWDCWEWTASALATLAMVLPSC